jgi:hypothetical protein
VPHQVQEHDFIEIIQLALIDRADESADDILVVLL